MLDDQVDYIDASYYPVDDVTPIDDVAQLMMLSSCMLLSVDDDIQ
jgi:hypothetical protein